MRSVQGAGSRALWWFAPLGWLALALCSPACLWERAPGTAVVGAAAASPSAPRPNRTRVVELRWEGVEALPIETLREVVRTEAAPEIAIWERARLPAEDVLAADAERIQAVYRRRGYYGAKVQYSVAPVRAASPNRAASPDRTSGRVEVIFTVAEGPPVRVRERAIRLGAPGGPIAHAEHAKILDGLPLEPGAVFDLDEYAAAKETLLKRLAERGYLGAKLRGGAEVDLESASARIDWEVETGPQVLQGPIDIQGLERVDEALVRAALAAEPGQPLSAEWLAERQKRLLELGLFRWATVEPVPSAEPIAVARTLWPIAVRVSERPPRTLSLSLGYATEEQLRARTSWEHRNLLGRGRTLRLGARHSSLGSSVESAVEWPDLLARSARAEFRASAFTETLEAYDARRLELRTTLERGLPSEWQGRIAHRFEIADTSAVSASAERLLDDPEQRSVVSVLEASLERRALDVIADPRRGHSVRVQAELSATPLGSAVDFLGGELDLRLYRPLGPTVLATRLQFGAVIPFGRSEPEQIPLTERLFAGGGDSVRGYEFQRLGPLDASGEPLGGTSLLVASAELRVPLRGRLGGVFFVDAGEVALDPLDFRASELRYTTGAGLRFETPVGPVRIDFGYPLNAPSGLEGGRVHLSVGHAF
jgi:outer membrane protein insertion porin family/translocation and assembly module TamA